MVKSPIILITIPNDPLPASPTPEAIPVGGNKGYNGLGVNKKAPIAAASGGIYSLKADDIIDDVFTINEDILNKTVLCKTTITNQYIAIFMLDIGKDNDYIIFKNVNDHQQNYEPTVENKNSSRDYAYLEFYGSGYSGNIFEPYIWGHSLEFNHAEAMFIKEGSKWRRVETKGGNRLVEEGSPKTDDLYVQQLIGDSIIRFKIQNIQYLEIGNGVVRTSKSILPQVDGVLDLGAEQGSFNKLYIKEIVHHSEATVIFDNTQLRLEYADDLMVFMQSQQQAF